MTEIIIYHNPRCSKSRQTLQLLQDSNITPEIILYLESPPTKNDLKNLLKKLGISARELLRNSEHAYKEAGLSDASLTENQLLEAMIKEPKLIQRPIVVAGDNAVLGRPPENVLELIKWTRPIFLYFTIHFMAQSQKWLRRLRGELSLLKG